MSKSPYLPFIIFILSFLTFSFCCEPEEVTREVGDYKNGKKDNVWTSWWDTERTRKEMQGTYRDGKMVDKWYFYNNKGNLKEIRYFSPVF